MKLVGRRLKMTIITNPSFQLLRTTKKKFKELLLNADDYVCLATLRFCNFQMKSCELVDHDEWSDIWAQMAIASPSVTTTYDIPEFYKPVIVDHYEEWMKDYVEFANGHYCDKRPTNCKEGILVWREITPSRFISRVANKTIKVGDPRKLKLYPKKFIKICEEHNDEIYKINCLFVGAFDKHLLIPLQLIKEHENNN